MVKIEIYIQTAGWPLLDQTQHLADYKFFALRSLFMAQRASRWPKLWLCSFQFPVCPVFVHCPVSLLCPLSCALLMSSMQLSATHTQASHPGPPHTHSLQQLSSNLSRTLFTCRPNWAQTYFNRSYFWAHMLVVRPELFSSLAGCLWNWSSCSADLTFCLFTSDQFPPTCDLLSAHPTAVTWTLYLAE